MNILVPLIRAIVAQICMNCSKILFLGAVVLAVFSRLFIVDQDIGFLGICIGGIGGTLSFLLALIADEDTVRDSF